MLAVGIWLVDAEGAAVPLPITVEDGWVSPCYARRDPAPVLVSGAQAEGSCMFVTVLAPSDMGAVLDLESLALLNIKHDFPLCGLRTMRSKDLTGHSPLRR